MKRSAGGRQRTRKVGPSLLVLGSSVVLAAYGAGWSGTRSFRDEREASAPASAIARATPTAFVVNPRRATTEPEQTAPSSPSPVPASPLATPEVAYHEGRYVGSGESIHGGVTIEVVIFEGRIVSAEITKCATRYPCSEIETLPAQAVERQSARLRYVSGATDSSRAYVRALEAALAKAL